ncbi:chemotaxis protein CheB [Asticcacaulis machinosus]|uniref:protein-glutamate methylesterase n=1 Tax=Asticcacaulis machinosus TaxID=2984211 RepID=A0ABT5HN50_9CAUL|nr:chemotaxis protein CheB [Asticcacaulis machinosus]MDC7677675.1 chemotaxis protein CheB [Asticcacaulis machinosus]
MPAPARKPYQAVVIGTSAGGLKALSAILPHLPADYPLPIMVVIHVPPHRQSLIAPLFEEKSQIRVIEAEDKTPIEGACVYFAPPDYHLLVEGNYELSLSSEEPVLFSRPSIDVLFETAADAYGDGLIGVILTGANNDGAAGLKAVMAAGGAGFIQTPQSAFARAMPEAAIEACPSALILDLDDILLELKKAA